ncbi:MAG: zeta toxin family protein [Bacteroides sp.]|nr:zeta toxin family protein [Bacteroides sp.]
MKKFTVIGGVNGVGKSSLSGVLSQDRTDLGIIIDTDKIMAKLGGDKIKGGKEAVRLIDECLEKGVSFTQETTLSGKRTLKTIEAAIAEDYYVRLFYIGISSAEESILRIKNRAKKGGHDISSEDVIRRYQKRFEYLAQILPFCDEVIFYDNENGFVYAGEYRNGHILEVREHAPSWLTEFKKYWERRE